MTNFAAQRTLEAPLLSRTTESIQIMRAGFQPDQLLDLIKLFEDDGHRCAVFDGFDGIKSVLSNPGTKLLFLMAEAEETARLSEVLKTARGGHDVPVLVCFTRPPHDNLSDTLPTEIDDFVFAPVSPVDLRLRVNRLAQRLNKSREDLVQVRQHLLSHFGIRQFIGRAPSFLSTVEKIPRVATCDATVLLLGETGTGKEMCARAIHHLSARASKPFIPVNCGSIPSDLFENELFGHESGAFTDARQTQRGLITECEGGTLFLDEVDTLPLSAQVKLLRFLQDRQYRPLGSARYRKADIRVLAATNQNLVSKVQAGTFREDLFYRLKVVTLPLPSLRHRREDIEPLAHHFLSMAAYEYSRPVKRFSQSALQKLVSYTWPGNVRELENVVRQAVVLSTGPVIRAADLLFSIEAAPVPNTPTLFKEPLKAAKARIIEEFERTYLETTLAACNGNISQAARRAQKDRRSFFALLKKYGLTSSRSLEQETEGDLQQDSE